MTQSPSMIRRTLYERLHKKQFNFPHAAAHLIATVYEPRSDNTQYSEEFVSTLTDVQNSIKEELRNELADSERSSLGAVEKHCLDQLSNLLSTEAIKNYSDVQSRLRRARSLSKGETEPQPSSRNRPPTLDSVPDPVTIREDRPPFGRWR